MIALRSRGFRHRFTARVCLAFICLVSAGLVPGASVSARGEKILFTTNRAGTLYRTAFYEVRPDGRGRKLVNRLPPEARFAVLAPSGSRILFRRHVGQDLALFSSDPSGAHTTRLSPPGLHVNMRPGNSGSLPDARFSPDGNRVAFSARAGGEPTLFVVGVDGRDLHAVANGLDPSWSPAGDRLAYSGNYYGYQPPGGVFVVGADGSGRRVLATDGTRPVWATRGERIAYSGTGLPSSRHALCITRSDGQGTRCLSGRNSDGLTWSPDAKHLAFSDVKGRLSVVDETGAHLRVLSRVAQPVAWSPDSRWIASVDGEWRRRLVIRRLNGGTARKLTQMATWTQIGDVRWHSSRISFSADHWSNDSELAVMAPDGSGLRILTRNQRRDLDPAWSPDRRTIAYVGGSTFTHGLRLIDADGKHLRVLTAHDTRLDSSPAWSPDGRKIAFVRRLDFRHPQGRLMVVNLATRAIRSIVGEDRAAPTHVSWSPDGRTIVFSAVKKGGLGGVDIYLVSPNGSGLRRVLTGAPFGFASSPEWSPDGSRLSFSRTEPPYTDWDLYTIRPDGTGLAHVANEIVPQGGGSWSPDGSRLVFARLDPRRPSGAQYQISSLVSVDAAGGNERVLTGDYSSNVGPDWSP